MIEQLQKYYCVRCERLYDTYKVEEDPNKRYCSHHDCFTKGQQRLDRLRSEQDKALRMSEINKGRMRINDSS